MRNAMWVGGGITGMGEIPMLGVKEKGIAKVIRDIFRNGEQGFFYDPKDLSTMFQGATGNVPVTAGQPVGLMLDKSKGLVLGGNVVTDGGFNDRTKWLSIGSGWSISEGNAVANNAALSTKLVQVAPNIVIKPNTYYEVTYSCTDWTSGQFGIFLGNNSANASRSGTGTFTERVLSGTLHGELWIRAGTTLTAKFDNITVKEIYGNHAYQNTSAARPLLLQKPIWGNNTITNGDFSNGLNSWSDVLAGTNGVWWQNVAGRAYHPSTTTFRELNQTFPTINTALVEFDYEVLSANNSAQFIYINSSGSVKTRLLPKGRGRATLTLTDGIKLVAFGRVNGQAAEFYIDSVSVKSVIGYIPDRNYIEYDGIEDKLFTNLPTPLVNATVLRAIPNVGTEVKYNQSIPMLYGDITTNAGLVAIDRALTRNEQLRLMDELDKKAGATSLDTLTFKVFDDNQEGFVYDPNDLTTLYQDATGTIPVTAVGQPVGLILDKSKSLALGDELVTNGDFTIGLDGWVGNNSVTFSRDSSIFSSGGAKLTVNTSASTYISSNLGPKFVVGKRYLVSADVYTPGTNTVDVVAAIGFVASNLSNNTVMQKNTNVVERVSMVFVATSTTHTLYCSVAKKNALAWGAVGDVVHFDNISVREVKGNHAFQTISASRPILRQNELTGANYLEFDGSDDFLQTNNIDFTDTDKVSLFTGVNKTTTNIAAGVILELGVNATTNSSSFFLASPNNNVRSLYGFRSRGKTTGTTLDVSSADIVVISAFSDLSANKNSLRLNSSESVQSIDTGGGVFGSYPLYIGRRGGTTLPFKGHIYGLIGVGRLTTNDETIAIEKELAKRVGVTLNV